MANTGEYPIRRAAGVMLWHLEKGHSNAEAIAKASKREPQMSEEQLRFALGWANAAQSFRDIMGLCKNALVEQKNDKGELVGFAAKPGSIQCSVQEAMDASGLSFYRDKSNWPLDS